MPTGYCDGHWATACAYSAQELGAGTRARRRRRRSGLRLRGEKKARQHQNNKKADQAGTCSNPTTGGGGTIAKAPMHLVRAIYA
jgi:hypothetical protein